MTEPFSASIFQVEVTEASDMIINMNVDGGLKIHVTEAANATILGRSQSADYIVSEAAKLDASNFQVLGSINACSSEAANLQFLANGQLSLMARESGTIRYMGNPTIVKSCSYEFGNIVHGN